MLRRMIVGAVTLVVINTILYGFVTWLPTFFVKDGRDIVKSMTFTALMTLGAPIGSAIGAYTADYWGRKPTIVGASIAAMALGGLYPFMRSPGALVTTGFLLIIPIYVLVTLLFAIYVPELFPTEVRLRASGICNAIGRSASIVTPWAVVMLFQRYNVEHEIEKINSRRVEMANGGSLVIDSTEALVAVDVNSGRYREQRNAEMTAFNINKEAIKEICRQLRLRDLGGVIVIDFIDMREERHKREIERLLRNNLKDDRAKTKVLRMSQFCMIEMTRQRVKRVLQRRRDGGEVPIALGGCRHKGHRGTSLRAHSKPLIITESK